MRLFVALEVADHVRTLVDVAREPARAVQPELSWTRPEGWHVTLAFIGNVPDEQLGAIHATVDGAVRGAPIDLAVGEVGRFSTRVLVAEVVDRPPGAVSTLGAGLQQALAEAHLPVDVRPLRPHLTLARASRRGARVTDDTVAAVAPVDASWEAGDVHLYASHLGGQGPARYESLASWGLRG